MEYALIPELAEIKEKNDEVTRIAAKESGRLLSYIKGRISSESDAEDILQDVLFRFISVFRSEQIENAASWLYHAAGNKIIDWYRKIKPHSLDGINEKINNDSEEGGESQNLRLEDVTGDAGILPEGMISRGEFWEMLEDLLEELPEKQREVFIMHELDNKSFREISETTGEAVNTLISRKRYAVVFLREKLRDFYAELLGN